MAESANEHDAIDTANELDSEGPLPEKSDAADWEADDSGVLNGWMHYEDEVMRMEHEFDDVDLDVHSTGDGSVSVIAEEDCDDWRSVSIDVDAETAEELAKQLELAAKFARMEESADVRV